MPLSATERTIRASIAAHHSWAKTPDRAARTEPARQGMQARFEREVDPAGVLPPAERARRAESARKAYFLGLSFKSARARRQAAEARASVPRLKRQAAETAADLERQAADADAELAAGGR